MRIGRPAWEPPNALAVGVCKVGLILSIELDRWGVNAQKVIKTGYFKGNYKVLYLLYETRPGVKTQMMLTSSNSFLLAI